MAIPEIRDSTDQTADIDATQRLAALLKSNLDFHDANSHYASHNLHAFPAKFPPQLPHKFIQELTTPGELVLDPMAGSGTTILEALLTGRRTIGFDIDPLAISMIGVKTSPVDNEQVRAVGAKVLAAARHMLETQHDRLETALIDRWDAKTHQFVMYWFARETCLELLALVDAINQITNTAIRAYLTLVFSATIITKSGGVSLALDLAHTRPHRAKIVKDRGGQIILQSDTSRVSPKRLKILTKTLRSPLAEFEKRLQHNTRAQIPAGLGRPLIAPADAQCLPLASDSVDLIVTSPPYASNAIDYMRAHKFSLVWMGYPIDELSDRRRAYIGGEAIDEDRLEALPPSVAHVVKTVAEQDAAKGRVLHRYYSEMTRTLSEMYRVLKPGKAAIVVVGSSTMRGRDTETDVCLSAIGRAAGFDVPAIGIRNLDRNRRMLPAGAKLNQDSQIQQRMHEEYVIGFYKPTGATT